LYADDLTIYASVNTVDDRIKFQNELDLLCNWANSWSLKINFDKCNVLHFGFSNAKFDYNLEGNLISHSDCEKVLGIYIDSKLCYSKHIYDIIKKASIMSNLILTNLYQCDNNVLIQLFKCYVRPILEYGNVIFSPHNVYLVNAIEHVQRNFTKRLHGLKNASYTDRLHICNLETLELRRLYNDLIFVYKILHGLVTIETTDLKLRDTFNIYTRGNNCKLLKVHCRLDVRKYFLFNRVVNMWNLLSNEVVNSHNIRTFNSKLHNVDFSVFLKGHAYK
jgi:hypothetical protein